MSISFLLKIDYIERMILGIGSDIIEIKRIEKLYARFGARFLDRVFTSHEQVYAASKPAHRIAILAKRFAAKEAMAKAFGIGVQKGIRLKDIEVVNDALGKPAIHLYAEARVIFEQRGGKRIHLSLSDDAGFAQAFVLVEGA